MFPEEDDVFRLLGEVGDSDTELEVVAEGYGTRTWAIDFGRGRLFRADPVRTKVERVIKYLLTPRGQVEIYPDFGTTDVETGYSSLVWTLYGDSFTSDEAARLALQAICDEAAQQVPNITTVTAQNVTVRDDRLVATIVVVTDEGEEETIDGIELSI